MSAKPWTKADDQRLKALASEGKYFFTEIAEKMNFSSAVVRWHAKKLGIPSTTKIIKSRFGEWNSKHAHLRKDVLTYFFNHTFEETRCKFKLTSSELKSLFSISYRLPELKHLRKDKRRKDAWTTKEYKFMIQHAGIMPRDWIVKKLKRGNRTCIKEKLQQLGVSSRSLNGITLSQFRMAFGKDPGFYIESKAGPGRNGTPTYYKIIPWVWLDQELKARRLKSVKVFRDLVHSMAIFQEWIFEGNALDKLKRIANTKDAA